MRIFWLVTAVSLGITACSKQDAADAPLKRTGAEQTATTAQRTMAYEHFVRLETEDERVAAAYETLRSVCKQAVADQCVVLKSSLSSGAYVNAELKFRAKSSGIEKVQQALAAQGNVTNQTTNAEDLAGPISDTAKNLEMLQDYRAKLEGLRAGASNNIEALIKVNKELAQVQSEIEGLTGKRAQLTERIETQILNIEIRSPHRSAFWKPVSSALADFGPNLAMGLSTAVTGLAYLIPWFLLLLVFGWILRKLWNRAKRSNRKG
jgi:hypothetical protein